MPLTVYLISAFLLLVAAFLIFRFFVRSDYMRKGRLTPFSTFLEYVVFSLWAYFTYINRPSDWPALHVSPIVRPVGWILFAGGMAMMLIGMVVLGIRRSHGLRANVLKQSGMYGVTRNPQSVTFTLGIIGYAMLWPSWQHLGSLILLLAILHIMVLTEEEHLRDKHGEEYARYCRRVPRYIGFPRRASAGNSRT